MVYNNNGRYVNDIVVLSLWLISMNELGERTLIHNISVILSFTMVYRIIQWTFQDPKMELRLYRSSGHSLWGYSLICLALNLIPLNPH